MTRAAGQMLTAVGDALFAPGCLRCAGAGHRQAGVCLECWAAVAAEHRRHGLVRKAQEPCRSCGSAACDLCLAADAHWSWMVTALPYSGAARDLVLLYKFSHGGGRLLLGRPLAELLTAAVLAAGIHRGVEAVTWVPSHRSRIRERGFDAARLLCRHLRRRLGLPAGRRYLARVGGDLPRARLVGARGPAGCGPFRLRRRLMRHLRGRCVLLIDDVLTTGATARRCAALLAAGGAREIRLAVLARTPLRRGPEASPGQIPGVTTPPVPGPPPRL